MCTSQSNANSLQIGPKRFVGTEPPYGGGESVDSRYGWPWVHKVYDFVKHLYRSVKSALIRLYGEKKRLRKHALVRKGKSLSGTVLR